MKAGRYRYYVLSFTLPVLAVCYCVLVFLSGQYEENQLGSFFLIGIPNYYFFYAVILPFISVGAMYLAFENKYIRFVGELSNDLDDKHRNKIRYLRKILLGSALLFSVLIVIQDAVEKDYTLPPHAFRFKTEQGEQQVAALYACVKGWGTCQRSILSADHASSYLEILQAHGFKGQRASGFDSVLHWYSQSSRTYKLESFLSFLGALIASVFIAEVFLLMMVKNYVKPATKDLIIWLVILASFWFPTKMYAAWHFNIGEFSTPGIFWFGIGVLGLAILLVFFLKAERNDLYKYASVIAAIASASIAGLSYFRPEIIQNWIEVMQNIGWTYVGMFFVLVAFSLYLVTDHFISNYEQETSQEK